jgi:prepilin-type N-terminal cleavage/methylation domain-containing protein
MKMNRSQRGVTLTELMIAVAILGIVFTVAPKLLINITRFFRLSNARIETQRAARDALGQINQTLRQATATSVVITQETSQPPASSIAFSTIDGRWLKYYQSGKDLEFVNNTSTRALASGLRYIAFSHPRSDDSTILSVSVTFEKDTYQGGTKALQMAIEKVRVMN